MREFDIGDIVEIQDELCEVTGVIHDQKRLFVTNNWNTGEIEKHFDMVYKQWKLVK